MAGIDAQGLTIAAAMVAGLPFMPAALAADPAPVNIEQAQEDLAFARGVEAYIWAYPLAITAATAEIATNTDKPLPNGHAPFNNFGHVGKLITAADKDGRRTPTRSMSAFLDLKQGAALISVPDTGGRYYSLMLEDAYTNVFGYIGLRATGSGAGQYLITGPGWQGETPAGAKRIDAPTPLVWVIGRTLIDGEKDMPTSRHPAPIYGRNDPARPRLGPGQAAFGHRAANGARSRSAGRYARLEDLLPLGRTADEGQSAARGRQRADKQFPAIGLTVENGFDADHLSPATQKGLERGYAAGKDVVKMEAQKSGGVEANGWAYNLNAGKWGQDFDLRAAIAFRSLGQNTPKKRFT